MSEEDLSVDKINEIMSEMQMNAASFEVIKPKNKIAEACGWEDFQYVGEKSEDGTPHGKGKIMFSNGSVYIGEIKHGSMDGIGQLIDKEGNEYNGEWKNDMREGHGKFENSTKENVFEGLYKKNKREGIGKEKCNGFHYEGNYMHGEWSGRGKLTYPCGDLYIGEFLDGDQSGQGKLFTEDGELKEGIWKEGELIVENF